MGSRASSGVRQERRAVRPLARLCRRSAFRRFLPARERDATVLSATCAAVYPVLAPLLSGRHTFAETTLLTLVQGLVGLGEGLTPSGDDCLVGLLAVLHVTSYLPSLCAPAVRTQLCQCVRLGTSQLSGEFVRCALEGHFAEPVVRLMRALCTPDTGVWQTHATELAAIGHSSGVDAMVGIVLGCRLARLGAGPGVRQERRAVRPFLA